MMTHARRRALSRYDFELTQAAHDALVRMIQTQKTTIVEAQSNRVSVHDAEYRGYSLRFAYDKQRKQIITFLYKDPAKYLEEAHAQTDS